jgi:hypothetical protein
LDTFVSQDLAQLKKYFPQLEDSWRKVAMVIMEEIDSDSLRYSSLDRLAIRNEFVTITILKKFGFSAWKPNQLSRLKIKLSKISDTDFDRDLTELVFFSRFIQLQSQLGSFLEVRLAKSPIRLSKEEMDTFKKNAADLAAISPFVDTIHKCTKLDSLNLTFRNLLKTRFFPDHESFELVSSIDRAHFMILLESAINRAIQLKKATNTKNVPR